MVILAHLPTSSIDKLISTMVRKNSEQSSECSLNDNSTSNWWSCS